LVLPRSADFGDKSPSKNNRGATKLKKRRSVVFSDDDNSGDDDNLPDLETGAGNNIDEVDSYTDVSSPIIP
jgi:hypothetical protein